MSLVVVPESVPRPEVFGRLSLAARHRRKADCWRNARRSWHLQKAQQHEQRAHQLEYQWSTQHPDRRST